MNFGLLAAEIVSLVWGTPANFNGFRVLAALLHGSLVVGVSQTLRRSTEGVTYIRQGGHQAGHWPTFLVMPILLREFFTAGCDYFMGISDGGRRLFKAVSSTADICKVYIVSDDD